MLNLFEKFFGRLPARCIVASLALSPAVAAFKTYANSELVSSRMILSLTLAADNIAACFADYGKDTNNPFMLPLPGFSYGGLQTAATSSAKLFGSSFHLHCGSYHLPYRINENKEDSHVCYIETAQIANGVKIRFAQLPNGDALFAGNWGVSLIGAWDFSHGGSPLRPYFTGIMKASDEKLFVQTAIILEQLCKARQHPHPA